jgi:hypothetical protein
VRTGRARQGYGFHRSVKDWMQPRAGVASRLILAESTSFTPFARYDVDRGREVAVVIDIHKVPCELAKEQVTGNR